MAWKGPVAARSMGVQVSLGTRLRTAAGANAGEGFDRKGLARLLEREGMDVIERAGAADDLFDLVREFRPVLAIVNVRKRPSHSTEGLDAASRI